MDCLAAPKGAVSPLNLVHDEEAKKVDLIVDAKIGDLKGGVCCMYVCICMFICAFAYVMCVIYTYIC